MVNGTPLASEPIPISSTSRGVPMKRSLAAAIALGIAAIAPAAYADDEPASAFTITGSAAVTTQYRLRGISQTDNDAAVQGGITVSHSSGVYIGTWASNLGGYGTFGGS